MQFTLGTEPTGAFYSYELAAAAHKLLNDIMLLRGGEELVISIDTAGDWRVAQALAEQAYVFGASPSVIRSCLKQQNRCPTCLIRRKQRRCGCLLLINQRCLLMSRRLR